MLLGWGDRRATSRCRPACCAKICGQLVETSQILMSKATGNVYIQNSSSCSLQFFFKAPRKSTPYVDKLSIQYSMLKCSDFLLSYRAWDKFETCHVQLHWPSYCTGRLLESWGPYRYAIRSFQGFWHSSSTNLLVHLLTCIRSHLHLSNIALELPKVNLLLEPIFTC